MKIQKILVFSSVILLSACNVQHQALNKANQLRSPEGLSHSYNYRDTESEDFVSFKNKMNLFATDISESFIDYYFEEDKNVCLSPLSIAMCLSLGARCANNKTREELLNALGVSYDELDNNFKLYYNTLFNEQYDSFNKLKSALYLSNSIWIDASARPVEEGLDALRDNYYCYSYDVDFVHDNKNTNKAIEQFIDEQTKGLIKPKLDLDIDTLFVLMNTLYLKDIWNDDGNNLSYANSDYKFTNLNKKVSDKKLLEGYYFSGKTLNTSTYSAFHTKTNSGYSIHFIKPNEGQTLKQVFTKENIAYVLDSSNYVYKDSEKKEKYETNCIFPEYTASCDEDIGELLNNEYNVKSLFVLPGCDFSNISQDDVYCSQLKHIAKLEVNKKGVEGAAVTIMAMAGEGMPDDWDYTLVRDTFVVDKEFGFVLTNRNNNVIFSGTVTNID